MNNVPVSTKWHLAGRPDLSKSIIDKSKPKFTELEKNKKKDKEIISLA